jgi:ABC-2 type transport system permease protein
MSMTTTARESALLAGRTVAHWRAQPGAFLVTLLFPVLVVLMMGGLFGGAVAGSTSAYLPFVVPGVLAMTMLFGLETTMIAVTTDATRTITDRFRSLPISSASVPAGRCLADLLASVLGLLVMVAAGLLLGWRWDDPGGALAGLGLLLWLRFGLLWTGLWLGLRARNAESVAAVQILVWPVGFLSTAFLDPVTMPRWLGAVAEWNPLSATVDATRELFGNPGVTGTTWASEHALLLALAWPLLLTVVFAPLAARAYRTLDR